MESQDEMGITEVDLERGSLQLFRERERVEKVQKRVYRGITPEGTDDINSEGTDGIDPMSQGYPKGKGKGQNEKRHLER